MEFNELPEAWQEYVRQLRHEAAKYRNHRNELRAELAALRAELGALNG